MTPKQVYTNPNAKGALNYGADFIVAKIIGASDISYSTYSVSEIIKAEKKIVAGTNYKFEVEISNESETVLFKAKYVVFRNLKGNYSIKSWSFNPIRGL